MMADLGKVACVLGLALLPVTAATAQAAALEPHRAAYRLTLDRGHQVDGLIDVQGGLVIEWQKACDGWLSRQRLGFVANTDGGTNFSHDVRFSSWESLDGQQMRYNVRSYEGEKLLEEYRGEAELNQGGGGVASFSAPTEQRIDLPPGTVFPTEHMRRILVEASQGQHMVSHEVFDGWGFDALTQVTSVIGAQRVPAKVETTGKPEDKGWPVSMAYYNIQANADLPEFEAQFVLTEQGVLQGLVLDYGDFRLKAMLEKLELLNPPAC